MNYLSFDEAEKLLPAALGLVDDVTPFPWQLRLLRKLAAGDVPSAIDIPTGLGKTSVIAIWLLARACGTPLPRRLVYVVDRRAVVDQASVVADGLVQLVQQNDALRTALQLPGRLPISTLRGQHIDNRQWLDDPSATAIIIGTVDMIGSRLLFEGYGVGRKTRSLHAALLTHDSLLVLDEAHLSPTFEALVRDIGTSPYNGVSTGLVPPRVKLLPLSATQKADDKAFVLISDDRNHDEVKRRLDAQKWMALREPLVDKVEKINPHAQKVADIAWERLLDGAQRVVVYLDSREQTQAAKEAFESLAKQNGRAIDTELLVGARRVFERNQVFDWLVEHGFHGDHKEPKAGVLFSTSAGEVGVDLDAEHMVCDLVAFERMVQRLGRVNRRGKYESFVDVVPMTKGEKKKAKAEEESEDDGDEAGSSSAEADLTKAVEELLTSLSAREKDGRRNLSPQALRHLQRDKPIEVAAASTPTPLRPALSRPLVEAWAMTSLAEHTARPRVEPWLRGWVDVKPQTSVVWRKRLPVTLNGKSLQHKFIRAYFEAAPAELIETLETETYNVIKWLAELKKKIDSAPGKITKVKEKNDQPTLAHLPNATDVVAFLVDSGGDIVINVGLAGLTLEMLAELDVGDLAGKTLFIDVRLGGVGQGLLSSKDDAEEVDDTEGRTTRFTLQHNTDNGVSTQWRRVFQAQVAIAEDGEIKQVLVIDQLIAKSRADEEGRSVSKHQSLTEHQTWAGDEAKRIGDALALPKDEITMLVAAAMHHDDGKASSRWQSAFHAPPEQQPLAKVGSWIDQGVLRGYRHEVGSLLGLIGVWDVYPAANAATALSSLTSERQELAKHLVSSHHGWSRPTLPVVGIEALPPSKLVDVQRDAALRFAALQEQWGPWGLAWWECLLRAADGIASRRNEQKNVKGGDT